MKKSVLATSLIALLATAPVSAQLLGGGLGVGGLGGGATGSISSATDVIGTTTRTTTNTTTRLPRAERPIKAPKLDSRTTENVNVLDGAATATAAGSVNTTTRQVTTAVDVGVTRPAVSVPAVPSVAVPSVAVPSIAVPSGTVGYLGGADVVQLGRTQVLIDDGVLLVPRNQVDAYLDRQVVFLERDLVGTGVEVVRQGKSIIIQMPADVTFAFDKATIQTRFFPVLNAVSKTLNQFPATYVDVIGHTDSVGSDAYNQSLSERRASSVATYLVSKRANPDRLYVEGNGEQEPVASNATISGRAANRRVEIVLTPHAES